ncbi:hypothetical protein ACHAXS_010618 [Conticribra weissflogii]
METITTTATTTISSLPCIDPCDRRCRHCHSHSHSHSHSRNRIPRRADCRSSRPTPTPSILSRRHRKTIRLASVAFYVTVLHPTAVVDRRGRTNYLASADESDHNFCGATWSDASSDCDDRQPCPNGSDEECTSGGTCWADTSCDATLGHGSQFQTDAVLAVPYDDPSNRKFCGTWWAVALGNCGLETHCATNDDCAQGDTCFETTCNVQDFLREEQEREKDELDKLDKLEKEKVERLPADDKRRKNYCGISWVDASAECAAPCLGGEDTDCPAGLICFGDTNCFYDDDLVPTAAPTTYQPTDARNQPESTYFCGSTWSAAIESCSSQTHCADDSDCPAGQTCFQYVPGCNIVDLLELEANRPNETNETTTEEVEASSLVSSDRNDLSNNRFCGWDWSSATKHCSLETHCPLGTDAECSPGTFCFSYLPDGECNAFDMLEASTDSPTGNPTRSPTLRPTHVPTVFVTEEPTEVVVPTVKPSKLKTSQPTDEPTKELTKQPTSTASTITLDDIHADNGVENDDTSSAYQTLDLVTNPQNLWCGNNQKNANKFCGAGIACPDLMCPYELRCFHVPLEECNGAGTAVLNGDHGIDGHRPTPYPTDLATKEPASLPTVSPTKSPTNQPTGVPTGDPTSEPTRLVTQSPTRFPTLSPMKNPTREPAHEPSMEPTNSPIATLTGSPTITIGTMATDQDVDIDELEQVDGPSSNLQLPRLLCASSFEGLTQSCSTAQSCENGPCPTGQSCFSFVCQRPPTTVSSLEINDEQHENEQPEQTLEFISSFAEQKQESGNDGPKFYCAPIVMQGFDGICGSVVECDDDNPCPRSQSCVQYDCEQPESITPFCPFAYSGWYFSKDCKIYHQCDRGVVGETHECPEGSLFDRLRNECVLEAMVNRFCFGPPLEAKEASSPPPSPNQSVQRAPPAPEDVQGTESAASLLDDGNETSAVPTLPIPSLQNVSIVNDDGEKENRTTVKSQAISTEDDKYSGLESWAEWEAFLELHRSSAPERALLHVSGQLFFYIFVPLCGMFYV